MYSKNYCAQNHATCFKQLLFVNIDIVIFFIDII